MMTPQEKIQEILQEILDKCSKDNYIFRGENIFRGKNKKHKKISSGLYRQYCQPDNGNSTNDRSPLIDNENFSILEVEKDIIQKVKRHIRPAALNIEVLTELQHYGGKTALIDFSENMHVALFFACDGNFEEDGRVILFETSELIEATDIDYKKMDENKEEHIYTLISPTGKSPRVIFQSSIFVHVSRGYLEKDRCKIIKIEKDIKKPLLEYLSKYFNIKDETIYNDIQGFIGNQHNYSNSSVEFYRGLTKKEENKFKEAIEHYNKAIDLNPKYAKAYNNRGNAKNALGRHKEAIKDYNKAIVLDHGNATAYNNRGIAKNTLGRHKEAIKDYNKAIDLNPKYAKAYNNRGIAKNALGRHKEAIKDYNKAIDLDPKYAKAYNNRGIANANLDNYEEAIKDYSKAIELDPKHANAYYNRGNANSNLGEYTKAIADYTEAKKIFEKKGNMPIVEKCEQKIERLKKLMPE